MINNQGRQDNSLFLNKVILMGENKAHIKLVHFTLRLFCQLVGEILILLMIS
jgi:hypothetical protein